MVVEVVLVDVEGRMVALLIVVAMVAVVVDTEDLLLTWVAVEGM